MLKGFARGRFFSTFTSMASPNASNKSQLCTKSPEEGSSMGKTGDKSNRLVWIDCEMSGLDPNTCHLLEVACLVTDRKNFRIIAEGPNIIIRQPKSVLDEMGDWCKQHHGESGLTEAVLKSRTTLAEAERSLLDFLKFNTNFGECPLAGNSVYMDKSFLTKYMPSLMDHLHYRIVDVSTIKELCRTWYPDVYKNAPVKKQSHRALDDIKESIAELVYYKKSIFR